MLNGQDVGRMAHYLDVLCPSLFPSRFQNGIPGYQGAIVHPYEIAHESTKRTVHIAKLAGCQVRPWIQDFSDDRCDRRVYRAAGVRAQFRGSFEPVGLGTRHGTHGSYTQDGRICKILLT